MSAHSETLADIAVIGLGIAGHAALLALRDSGHAIVAVTPTSVSGEGKARDVGGRVGDSLSPAANATLRDLGLCDAFAAVPHRNANATYAAWGSNLLFERNAIVHTEGPGHVIDRPAFEKMLADAVAPADIVRRVGALVRTERHAGQWRLALDNHCTIRTRFVLDCSGRRAVFAGKVARRQRADRLIAACAFLTQSNKSIEPTPATLIEAVPDGWWYTTLLPDDRISLALFSDADLLPRGLSRHPDAWRDALAGTRYVKRWLDSAGYRAEVPPRLTSAGTAWLTPAAGDGWAAAGDAAASFDPLSSHGIASALWSARQAALAAAEYLRDDDRLLRRYAATIDAAVQNFQLQRAAIYSAERRFAGQPFWQRRIAAVPTAQPDTTRDAKLL